MAANVAGNEANREPNADADHDRFLVVGLGASAGGSQALGAFFEQVPADSGAAFVVLGNPSSDSDGKLADVLRHVSSIPLIQVDERVRLAPDTIFLASDDQHLSLADGELVVSATSGPENNRAPVDMFFRSLGEARGSEAVAVILSGTGASGSMGLKRVKERGGAVLVQNPREAASSEMPRHAIATGLVDEILSAALMPGRILSYRDRLRSLVPPPDEAAKVSEAPEGQPALGDILAELKAATGHEFSNYKRPSLLRRIARRVSVHDLPDLAAYAAYLRENPGEVRLLLKDLLISVTNFFRDPEAFAELDREVIPQVLSGKGSGDVVRVWVVGCATGEEAYSVAMLLAERTEGRIDAPKVQIFATDIDERALEVAREGLYAANDVADVSPERLSRFFNKVGSVYRVRREIREMMLFARHNVITDPPFSRLDLATCRNLLIYLNPSAQQRVLETLHFALNSTGHLMLGGSESVASAGDLYVKVSQEQHLFRRRPVPTRQYPLPATVPTFGTEPEATSAAPGGGLVRSTYGDLHGRLLEAFAPPSVVVDQQYDLVHLSERAGGYLRLGAGEMSSNLLELVRPELRLGLRSALRQAVSQRTNVEARVVRLDDQHSVRMHVHPVLSDDDAARGFILVLFEDADREAVRESVAATDEPFAEQLEAELATIKHQLRQTEEQNDLKNEALRASNKELLALNEELRSASEELETSKEELQSINEELSTVNQELRVQIEETTLVSNNLQNLINATDIGVIFLDRSLRVQLFSPAARELFNLIPADVGRPLADITHRLEYDDLLDDARAVLEKLHGVEREVTSRDDRAYQMRVLPYRTTEDRISGAVVTFVDISQRKRAEDIQRASEERLRLLIESAKGFAIFTMDEERRVTSWNTGAQALFGYEEEELLGGAADVLFTPEDREAGVPELEIRTAKLEGRAGGERWHLRKDGSRFFGSGLVNPLMAPGGGLQGFVKIMRDLTEKRLAEEAVRTSEAKYRSLFDSIDEGFSIIEMIHDKTGKSVDYRFLEVNLVFEDQTGLADAAGKTALELVPDLERKWIEAYDRVAKTGESVRFEQSSPAMGRVFDVYASAIDGVGDQVALVFRDITQRKRVEANKALLAEIGVDLNVLVTPEEIARAAASRLGAHLGLATCVLVDVDEDRDEVVVRHGWDPSGAPVTADQTQQLSVFLSSASARTQADGDVLNISDTSLVGAAMKGFAGSAAGSALSVPYLHEGRWTASLIATDAAARTWQPDEIELVRDVAERVFPRIERARVEEALRELDSNLESEVRERTQALLTSRARFEQAFQAGPTAAVITSVDEDRIMDVNEVFVELTGYTLAEVEGRRASDLGFWARQQDQDRIAAALAGDRDGYRQVQLSLCTEAGELRDILMSAQQISVEGSRAWLKMFLDVTERNRSQEEVMVAIDRVMADTDWFSQQVSERLSQIRSGPKNQQDAEELLSARQIEILQLLAEGHKNQAVASLLGLSPKTVRNHIANIYGKIGVSSRVDAVLWARERGLGG